MEELRREKAKLKGKLKKSADEPAFSFTDILGKDKKGGEEGIGSILTIAQDLLASPSVANTVMTLGLPLLKMAGRRVKRNVLLNIGKELLGGYLKYKAAELGFKGVKNYVKSKQEEKKEAHHSK